MNAVSTPHDLRHKALFAASTVALAFHVGCADAGKTVVTDTSTSPDTDATLTDSDDAIVDSDAHTDPDSDTQTAETDADTDHTDAVVDTNLPRPDCAIDTDGVIDFDCCDDLAAWCAATYAGDLDAENTCIWGEGFDGSTGCIPWGPPAPPAARRRLA